MDSYSPAILLWPVRMPQDWGQARGILAEYGESLGVDLSFQHFDQELADLASAYSAPGEGFLPANVGGAPAGFCGRLGGARGGEGGGEWG